MLVRNDKLENKLFEQEKVEILLQELRKQEEDKKLEAIAKKNIKKQTDAEEIRRKRIFKFFIEKV
jgi:hypothetical protein